MKRFVIILTTLMLLAGQTAFAVEHRKKVAVLDFVLQGTGYETDAMGKFVSEWFITALVQEGRFDVIERGLMKKILEEQKLAMTGIIDQSTASKLGKILGVDFIISGTLLKLNNTMEINSRIIEVESGSILAAENVKSYTSVTLQDQVIALSEKIMSNFPLEGFIVQKTAASVTIDMGRRSGIKKGMKFMVFTDGKTIVHPVTGKVLDVEMIKTGMVLIKNVRSNLSEGEVILEYFENAIKYGHRVRSIYEPKQQITKAVVPTVKKPKAKPKKKKPKKKIAKNPSADSKKAKEIKQLFIWLKSDKPKEIRKAARQIAKSYNKHPGLMKTVELVLLKRYKEKTRNRNHTDAMSWLCNVLGASKDLKYKKTLETVKENAPARKLKSYATKNLKKLK